MTFAVRFLPFVAILAILLPASAADPAPAPPKTHMIAPGKLILTDDLAGPLAKDWKVGKGKWEPVDGATRGAEVKADMHGAVTRRNFSAKDIVIECAFKLDGAKQISWSLNSAKGHVSRAVVRPTGFTVQKDDQDGKTGPDKPTVLDTKDVTIAPGVWHTLVIELRGPDILATLDGTTTAFGSHEAIDKEKANLGLTVSGESASFRGLRVWASADPLPGWDATRAKLLESRKK